MKFGVIPNMSKDTDLSITKDIVNWLLERDMEVQVNEMVASRLFKKDLTCSMEDIFTKSDIIIALGGDGTILNIARQAAFHDTPIFGINLGHLGFLTEAEITDMYFVLDKLLNNEYHIERRMMLEAQIEKDNIHMEKFVALNDIGVTRGHFSRIISYSIYINERFIDLFSADGLIVSTPTGSTAYSLSAGGPIVSPNVDVMLLTHICPHTLHSRSIVVSSADTIRIEVCAVQSEIMLTADGQHGYKLKPGDTITVKKSPYYTSLIKLNQRNFYDVLRRKMSERWTAKIY